MSILLAVSGWDPEAWRARLTPALPRHPIAILGESFERAAIRYALSWHHPPGSLAELPELRAIFYSALASTTFSPIPLCPTGRSCVSSIRTSETE